MKGEMLPRLESRQRATVFRQQVVRAAMLCLIDDGGDAKGTRACPSPERRLASFCPLKRRLQVSAELGPSSPCAIDVVLPSPAYPLYAYGGSQARCAHERGAGQHSKGSGVEHGRRHS
jgi:hypothetical protein